MVRDKLSHLNEITFLEAVMWVTDGHHPNDRAYEAWQMEVYESQERFCDAFRDKQDRLGLASLTISPLSEGIEQVLSKQELLSDEELDILEKSKSATEDDLQKTRLFNLAMSELFKHASEGRVKIRAKPHPWSTLPEPLDPAYFRNPVTFHADEEQFVFDASAPMDEYALFRNMDELTQFDPLVDVKSLRSAFPEQISKKGPMLEAARKWALTQDQTPGERWLKTELLDYLAGLHDCGSPHAQSQVAKQISQENPGRFRRGRPPKNK